MNNFTPRIIKPCRNTAKSPKLKISRCIKNYKKGVETSLFLDLNILSKMREVVDTKIVNYSNSGLMGLVKILNSLPALYLSPGFAISEVRQDYLESLMVAYENFLEKYCPGYVDAHNATKNYKNIKEKPLKFEDFDKSEKYFNSVAYLGILRVQILDRKGLGDPCYKYESYLSYMMDKANMVGVIESEVAKYVFSDIKSISDQKFRAFSSMIKDNFKKGGNNSENVLINCLNSARDIMYYRATADRSNEYFDGKLQDTWLVTADAGLWKLSESIHFVPNVEGCDSKYVTFVRNKEQKKSLYWNYCDQITISNLDFRKLVRELSGHNYSFGDSDLDYLLDCISESEDELLAVVNSQ
ncbi:MAG: hypothetical protein K6L73_07435 [Cellvibrionaceae bacterium]